MYGIVIGNIFHRDGFPKVKRLLVFASRLECLYHLNTGTGQVLEQAKSLPEATFIDIYIDTDMIIIIISVL